jgi:hypothetical protein
MCNRKCRFRLLSVGIGCLSVMGLLIVGAVRSEDTRPVNTAPPMLDIGKTAHNEPLVKQLVAAKSSTIANTENPKVKPGLVKWHSNFAEACEASKKSGKPVLLFQMMGKLDDQFC